MSKEVSIRFDRQTMQEIRELVKSFYMQSNEFEWRFGQYGNLRVRILKDIIIGEKVFFISVSQQDGQVIVDDATKFTLQLCISSTQNWKTY